MSRLSCSAELYKLIEDEEITNESHFLGTLNTHYRDDKLIMIRINNIFYIYLNDIYKN